MTPWSRSRLQVLMTEERACPTCHTRIGTRMFASLPGGAVQCYRCYQKTQGHVQPAEKP